jgi:hypothetical protein
MKFRKKPVVIEATQWFKNGDHPQDRCETFQVEGGEPFQGEGHIVRYFRHPDVPGEKSCEHCGQTMHVHGWIDTLEGGYIVCPGDWIITGVKGELYPCKPDIFAATYEQVVEKTAFASERVEDSLRYFGVSASGEVLPGSNDLPDQTP